MSASGADASDARPSMVGTPLQPIASAAAAAQEKVGVLGAAQLADPEQPGVPRMIVAASRQNPRRVFINDGMRYRPRRGKSRSWLEQYRPLKRARQGAGCGDPGPAGYVLGIRGHGGSRREDWVDVVASAAGILFNITGIIGVLYTDQPPLDWRARASIASASAVYLATSSWSTTPTMFPLATNALASRMAHADSSKRR